MSQRSPEIISALEQEIVVITLTTLVRLFDLDSDAALLYVFYCKNAKLQANQIGYTNQVYAGREFCMRGLHWGKEKYGKSRKLLLDNGFIEEVRKRSQHGEIEHVFVRINYLLKSYNELTDHLPVLGQVDKVPQNPPAGFRPPNAVDEKKNAVDKKNKRTGTTYSNTLPLPHDSGGAASISSKLHEKTYSKKKFQPLGGLKIWEIALSNNVSPKVVALIEKNVRLSIANGNKYGVKNIADTVEAWINNGLQRGNIQYLGEEERMVYQMMSPQHALDVLKEIERIEKNEK